MSEMKNVNSSAPLAEGKGGYAERGKSTPIAGQVPGGGNFGAAEHHQRAAEGPATHKFDKHPATGAHGFGHPVHVRSGPLRNSGHGSAHRVGGKKGK